MKPLKNHISVKRRIEELQRQDIAERTVKRRFSRALRRAKARGVTWGISFKDYASLVTLPCTYCHELKFEAGTGLDRLDNARGYYLDNTKPCCFVCNVMKQCFPPEFFRQMAGRVRKK